MTNAEKFKEVFGEPNEVFGGLYCMILYYECDEKISFDRLWWESEYKEVKECDTDENRD